MSLLKSENVARHDDATRSSMSVGGKSVDGHPGAPRLSEQCEPRLPA